MHVWVSMLLGSLKGLLGPAAIILPFLPYILGGSAILGAGGYIYHKGRVHERHAQARIIAEVNKKIDTWAAAQSQSDAAERQRIDLAVSKAQADFAKKPQAVGCKMSTEAASHINDIAGIK